MNTPADRTPAGTDLSDDRHRALREQLGALALGQLAEGERRAVEAHVRDCSPCREEFLALRSLARPLAALDPDDVATPPSDPAVDSDAPTAEGFAALRDRIRAEAAAGSGPSAAAPAAGPVTERPADVVPLRRRYRRRVLLAAASGAVVFLLGAGIGTLASPGLGGNDPFEPVSVQALAPGIDASAGVVPHTWGVEVRLTASGFAPGETYRATVRDGSGRTVSAGEFIGTGAEEMECNLNSSILRENATGFTITDETGRPVLTSSI